jgi:hypothetical protein
VNAAMNVSNSPAAVLARECDSRTGMVAVPLGRRERRAYNREYMRRWRARPENYAREQESRQRYHLRRKIRSLETVEREERVRGSASSPLRGSASSPLRGSAGSPLRGSAGSPLRGSASSSLRGSASSPLRGSGGSAPRGSGGSPLRGSASSSLRGSAGSPLRGSGGSAPRGSGGSPPRRLCSFCHQREPVATIRRLKPIPGGFVEVHVPYCGEC